MRMASRTAPPSPAIRMNPGCGPSFRAWCAGSARSSPAARLRRRRARRPSMPADSSAATFVGIVGDQADLRDAQQLEDLGGQLVFAAVGGEAQLDVGFDGIHALILQLVGLQLGHQADAAALLLLVEQDAGAGSRRSCPGPVPVAGGNRSAASRRRRRSGIASECGPAAARRECRP